MKELCVKQCGQNYICHELFRLPCRKKLSQTSLVGSAKNYIGYASVMKNTSLSITPIVLELYVRTTYARTTDFQPNISQQ